MKRIISATLLSAALLAAPLAQAASYQDRAMATGAVVGASTGAVVGSGRVRMWRGGLRCKPICCRPFRLAVPQ